MGCVVYPVQLGSTTGRTRLIILDYPIGSFEVQTSRDGLRLDYDQTVKIGQRYDEAQAEWRLSVQAELDAEPTLLDAMLRLASNDVASGSSYFSGDRWTYQGKVINSHGFYIKSDWTEAYRKNISYKTFGDHQLNIDSSYKTNFIVIDDEPLLERRLRSFKDELGEKSVYTIRRDDIEDNVFEFLEKKHDVYYAKDYPPAATNRTKNPNIEFDVMSNSYGSEPNKLLRSKLSECDDETLYVKKVGAHVVFQGKEYAPKEAAKIISALVRCGVVVAPEGVVAVTETHLKTFPGKSFEDLYESYIKQTDDGFEQVLRSNCFTSFHSDVRVTYSVLVTVVDQFPDHAGLLEPIANPFNAYRKMIANFQDLQFLRPPYVAGETSEIDDYWELLKLDYPLLRFCNQMTPSEINDYLTLVKK